jgi:hypothetical protein
MKLSTILVTILILMPMVESFGITSPYYKGNPLRMQAGEETNITLLLQNMIGEENYNARARIVMGEEIATITDNGEYYVPYGKKDIEINIRVKIPERPIEDYSIKVEVIAQPESAKEQLNFAQGVGAEIPVEITGKEGKKWLLTSIIAILIILAIAILYNIVGKGLKKPKY